MILRMLNGPVNRQAGVTLLELMLVVALVSLLSVIAVPTYRRVIENLLVSQARTELMQISMEITRRRQADGRLPETLAGIPNLPVADPWGRPYAYYCFSAPGFNRGRVRKDRNLVPINSEFDLYSAGKDGDSRPPLTARPSQDDVVIARDGAFVGLAKDF